MEKEPVIMIIGANPPPGMEEEFDKWYIEKHIPEVLKFKGIRKATRYKIIPIEGEDLGNCPRGLAWYEFDSLEYAKAWASSPDRISPRDDFNSWVKKGTEMVWRVRYAEKKTWQR